MSKRVTGRTLLGDILWAPWSAVAWVLSMAWMVFLFVVTIPLCLFRPFEKFQMIWCHPQLGWPVRFTFSRLRVEIDPRYDRSRVSVFAQNHVTAMDANIACGSIPVPMCGLENASHLNVPGYGWLLRMANAIPVRKGARRYQELAAAFRERASRGISILTFPEAHRTRDGNVQPFKRGVFRMARDAGLPIAPVCTRGAFRMLPKGALTSRPSLIEVYIGPQVETEGLSDRQLEILGGRMRETMQAWIDRREKRADLYLAPLDPAEAENVA
jgi:1-acyl-sn-glycerol-3-phosphate acyltransferase